MNGVQELPGLSCCLVNGGVEVRMVLKSRLGEVKSVLMCSAFRDRIRVFHGVRSTDRGKHRNI